MTASIASELIWIEQLFANVGIISHSPMKIFYDNQAARQITSNLVFYERTKHIEMNCHFIRETIQTKEIKTPFIYEK